MPIPEFPSSVPLSLEARGELQDIFNPLEDGVAEFTFQGLYLFRSKYNYRLSQSNGALLILGGRMGKTFFAAVSELPPEDVLHQLLEEHDEWKLISPSLFEREREFFERLSEQGFSVVEDRDNFDYLYRRVDLAELRGKALHKKKSHVNAFIRANESIRLEPLSARNIPAAREVLEAWIAGQKDPADTDYQPAVDALDALEGGAPDISGLLLFAGDVPAGWCLSELSANGTMAIVHFEKARPDIPGAFQYINYAFARSLPESVLLVNREQDLGDEGLRQAKMTYRPCGFVKKYAAMRGQKASAT